MKKAYILSFLLLAGCAVDLNAPQSNYARTGVYKDAIDHHYYNYVEAGKNIPVSKRGSVNAIVGLSNEGSERTIQLGEHIEDYWELNYEYRW